MKLTPGSPTHQGFSKGTKSLPWFGRTQHDQKQKNKKKQRQLYYFSLK
jgi:hypothetical protein